MNQDLRDNREPGWSGFVEGRMDARDERIEATGGWANDPRSLLARVADLLAVYAIAIAVAIGAMALLTVWFDSVTT